MIFLFCFLIFIAVTLAYIIYAYNNFIRLENMLQEAWSGIDVQLKRRYDLIPQLVKVAQLYAKHEEETFLKTINARNNAAQKDAPQDKEKYENEFVKSLNNIFALAEAYPDLKACDQFIELQKNLCIIEDTLQKARRYYNATARNFNISLHSFPSCIIGQKLKLSDKPFFQIEELERKNVEIKI